MAIALVLGLLALLVVTRLFSRSGAIPEAAFPSLAANIRTRMFSLMQPSKKQWVFSRNSQSQSDDHLCVVRHFTLTATHRLHVIRVHGRDLLLVTHPQGCQQLDLPFESMATQSAPAGGES